MDDLDIVQQSDRYLLVDELDRYSIRDLRSEAGVVEEFPYSQDGFERASHRFRTLTRLDHLETGRPLRKLWLVVIVGAGLFLLGGISELFLVIFQEDPFGGRLVELTYFLSTTGYRVAVVGLILLLGASLMRREALGPSDRAQAAPHEEPVWQVWARRTLVTAMGVWILSSIATGILFPYWELDSDRPARIAAVIESLVFRIWVSALVVLTLSWARRAIGIRSASRETPAE